MPFRKLIGISSGYARHVNMSKSKVSHLTKFSDGEVCFWIADGGAIHLKAITKSGDPVELSEEEATELTKALLDHVALLEDDAGVAR